jgi:nuclear transport factor 2 (NTF2) superfamily protein
MAYTPDSIWRNRDQFLQGRDAIQEFLTKKWQKEHNYRLRKELFAFTDNKAGFVNFDCCDHPIAVKQGQAISNTKDNAIDRSAILV